MLERSLGKSFSKIPVLSRVREEIVLGAQILTWKTLDSELKDGNNKKLPPEFLLAGCLPKVRPLAALSTFPLARRELLKGSLAVTDPLCFQPTPSTDRSYLESFLEHSTVANNSLKGQQSVHGLRELCSPLISEVNA